MTTKTDVKRLKDMKENDPKLHEKIGIDTGTLSSFIDGSRNPQSRTREKISKLLKGNGDGSSNLPTTSNIEKVEAIPTTGSAKGSGTSKVNKEIKKKTKIASPKSKITITKEDEVENLVNKLVEMQLNEDSPDLVKIITLFNHRSQEYKLLDKLINGYNTDCKGHLYYYYIDNNHNELKIGRGKSLDRVRIQASKKKQFYYFNSIEVDEYKLMERVVHLILHAKRFSKPRGDGRTEWFRVSEEEVIEVIEKPMILLEIKSQ
jgi:hypothetical protein